MNCFFCSEPAEYRKEIGNEDNPYQGVVCELHFLSEEKQSQLNQMCEVLDELFKRMVYGKYEGIKSVDK